jgi:hypothetical protein
MKRITGSEMKLNKLNNVCFFASKQKEAKRRAEVSSFFDKIGETGTKTVSALLC